MDDFVPLRCETKSSVSTSNVDDYDLSTERFRNKCGIEVDGANVPPPIKTFDEIGLHRRVLDYIKSEKQFERMTAIQMQAISCLMQKRDVIGLSSTGTGKTYAYLLPLCLMLQKNTSPGSVIGLIVVPSRELMAQVRGELNELLDCICLRSVVVGVCGGIAIQSDVSLLSDSTKVVIATPGRLLDLCNKKLLSLERVEYLVIDECDKMLEEFGFEEDLRKIVAMATLSGHEDVRTSLWSATLPESLQRLARSAVINPVYICTGVENTVPRNITQHVVFMQSYMKVRHLLDALRQTPFPPVIIFTGSKTKADELAEILLEEEFDAATMHSGKAQRERNEIMRSFKNDDLDVLIATDLISRGLDIPAVTHVINFDTPDTIQDYIHRCGRTGRFGRVGMATTFLTRRCSIRRELKELLESSKSDVPDELNDASLFGQRVLETEMGDRIVE